MKTPFAFASALAFALPLAGCSFSLGSSTKGDEGRAEFAYTSLDGCFFGCDTSRPLMRGTHEAIFVSGDDLPSNLTFGTDDGAVIAVSGVAPMACCDTDKGSSCGDATPTQSCAGKLTFNYTVEIDAPGNGTANLVARTADGQLFDSLPFQVVAPARLDLHCPMSGDDSPAITQLDLSTTCAFEIDAFGASGEQLQASSGFDITAADPTLVEVRPDFFIDFGFGSPLPPVHEATGSLQSKGQGSTTLSIKAGTATTTVALTTH